MISSSVFAAFIFAAAVELVFPVVLLLVLGLKKKISVKPMFFGAAAFFVSQICLRIPILQVLGAQSWYKSFALNIIPYVLTLAFTAGLFEESARYIGARLLKNERAYRDAVSFGLGHGLCEVILITGMAQINNIIYSTMINNGTLASSLPAATANQILSVMLTATPAMIFMGLWERVSTVLFHVFATVLIFKGVNEHKIRYYFYALAAHTVCDTAAPLLAKYVNAWVTEMVLFVIGIAGLIYVLKVKPSFRQKSLDEPPVAPTIQGNV